MYISLPELEAILAASREKEQHNQRFLAAIQGIDLDKQSKDSVDERFKAAQIRAQAALEGKNKEEVELDEIEMDYEVEE